MHFILHSIKWIFILLFTGLLSGYLLDRYIAYTSGSRIYTEIKDLPQKKAALLLGTAKYVAKGKKNYFLVRIV